MHKRVEQENQLLLAFESVFQNVRASPGCKKHNRRESEFVRLNRSLVASRNDFIVFL